MPVHSGLPDCVNRSVFALLLAAAFAVGDTETVSAQSRPHPSVVQVVVQEGRSMSRGSGTLVAVTEETGVIVTNWHVVRGAAGPIQVTFSDGFHSQARILGSDRVWDLAALLIWRPEANPVSIETRPPRPGEALTIAGYGSGSFRVSTGRCVRYVSPGGSMPYEMLQLSTQARQGDSGGPIFNQQGALVGVLFGASRGSTTGSYGGRVKQFLDSVWPDTPEPSGLLAGAPERDALGGDRQPSDALPGPNVAIAGHENGLVAAASSTLLESPVGGNIDWTALIGASPVEQIKSVFAVIGVLAILLKLRRRTPA